MTTAPHDAWNILFEKKLFVRAETKRKLIPGNSVYQGGVEGCVCVASPCKVWPDWANFETSGWQKLLQKLTNILIFFAILKKFTVGTFRLLFCKIGLIFTPALVTLLMYERLSSTFPNFNLKCYPWQRGSLLGFTVDKIVINMLWDNLDFPQINMSIR